MVLIEIGNTSVKAVLEQPEGRLPLFKVDSTSKVKLRDRVSSLKDGEDVILSSVRKDLTEVVSEQKKRLRIHIPTYNNLGAMKLDYDTPNTLGIDRVLACAGGVRLTKSDVVVVDAGTACTIDLMSEDYCFKGGVIMPGVKTLRHSMNTLTPELPSVDSEIPDQFPGKSTRDAIKHGLNGGFIYSIRQFIKKYIEYDSSVQILVTGGDGPFVQHHLQKTIKCTFHENLVFDGMLAWRELTNLKT